jgi:hypothetical protein
MSQLGEFLATIQNKQDARISALEERLATLEAKEECGCAETISTLEERLATLEGKEECGCAETIATLEERLATLESKEECGCAETISTLEERLATLEAKEECGCGSYDELLASYEERISALEGNTGGSTEGEGDDSGSTEGEGGSTEGEGEEEGEGGSTEGEGGSTEPMTASQALAKYNHLIGLVTEECFDSYKNETYYKKYFMFISTHDHKYGIEDYSNNIDQPETVNHTVAYIFKGNEGDIVKVYTPDLQEIEIIADSTHPYHFVRQWPGSIAFGNKETKEVYCYDIDLDNQTISLCTDEAFIAKWGNSDALGL